MTEREDFPPNDVVPDFHTDSAFELAQKDFKKDEYERFKNTVTKNRMRLMAFPKKSIEFLDLPHGLKCIMDRVNKEEYNHLREDEYDYSEIKKMNYDWHLSTSTQLNSEVYE